MAAETMRGTAHGTIPRQSGPPCELAAVDRGGGLGDRGQAGVRPEAELRWGKRSGVGSLRGVCSPQRVPKRGGPPHSSLSLSLSEKNLLESCFI